MSAGEDARLRLQYIGAAALLARLSLQVRDAETQEVIGAALRDFHDLFSEQFDLLQFDTGGFALELRQSTRDDYHGKMPITD